MKYAAIGIGLVVQVGCAVENLAHVNLQHNIVDQIFMATTCIGYLLLNYPSVAICLALVLIKEFIFENTKQCVRNIIGTLNQIG